MLKSEGFAQVLIDNGFDFFTGVPCTIIGNLITTLTERPDVTYIPAVREDVAVGVASGALYGGEDTRSINAKLRIGTMPERSYLSQPHLQASLLINSNMARLRR